jgi:hypothetical protein
VYLTPLSPATVPTSVTILIVRFEVAEPYNLLSILRDCTYGCVRLARKPQSTVLVAVKQLDKKRIRPDSEDSKSHLKDALQEVCLFACPPK